MSFFGFGKSTSKGDSKIDKIKIFSDYSLKSALKISPELNCTCQMILKQIVAVQQGDDINRMLVLLVCNKSKNREILVQRKLDNDERVMRILDQRDPNLEQYLMYLEISNVKLQEMMLYHHETIKLNGIIQMEDQYQRCGVLLKKSKNGQFRERLFKLMKDCLIYSKVEKRHATPKLSLKNLRIRTQYLIQLWILKQLHQELKARQITMDGWIYSIHNHCVKAKEIKLLHDFDKRIYMFQKQRVDNYKNAAAHSTNLKSLFKSNHYIIEEFVQHVIKFQDPFEIKLLEFIQVCQQIEELENQKHKGNSATFIENRQQLLDEILAMTDNWNEFHTYLSDNDHHSYSAIRHAAILYLEHKRFNQLLESGSIKQMVLQLLVQQFTSFMKFPIPDVGCFWSEVKEETNQEQISTPLKKQQTQSKSFAQYES